MITRIDCCLGMITKIRASGWGGAAETGYLRVGDMFSLRCLLEQTICLDHDEC